MLVHLTWNFSSGEVEVGNCKKEFVYDRQNVIPLPPGSHLRLPMLTNRQNQRNPVDASGSQHAFVLTTADSRFLLLPQSFCCMLLRSGSVHGKAMQAFMYQATIHCLLLCSSFPASERMPEAPTQPDEQVVHPV